MCAKVCGTYALIGLVYRPSLGLFYLENMKSFIVAKKKKQEQAFLDKRRIVTTFLKVIPTYVVGYHTEEKDGYSSVVFAYGEPNNDVNKPQRGQLKKAGIVAPLRFLKEVRIPRTQQVTEITEEGKKGVKVGENTFIVGMQTIVSESFVENDMVRVTATSKGKGFQGVVKRHGFAGGPRTHGQSDRERAPGSIGSGTTPGRINKGKRMAGRMGSETVTLKGLQVVKSSATELCIKGLVPGSVNSYVFIENTTT